MELGIEHVRMLLEEQSNEAAIHVFDALRLRFDGALSRLVDNQELDDYYQELYVKLVVDQPTVNTVEAFYSWTWKVLKNISHDRRRAERVKSTQRYLESRGSRFPEIGESAEQRLFEVFTEVESRGQELCQT